MLITDNQQRVEGMKTKTKTMEVLLLASLLGIGVGALAGCESQGPFEEAGEEIDDAADEIEDEL